MSWRNAGSRLLQALLIAALLMLGRPLLGEEPARAATDKDDYCQQKTVTLNMSVDVYMDSNLPVAREWYPYEAQANIELRTTPTYSSNNLYATIVTGTELQIDLLHVTKAVVDSKTYWYAPVRLNDDKVVYCDIGDQTAIRPMRAPSGNDWWTYKVVWNNGIKMRSFADSNCTTNIEMSIAKDTVLELDLNHTAIEPKFGDTWAFARYQQSDGSYVYGWCLESDSAYMQQLEQLKQMPLWYDYFADQGRAVYIYRTQNVDDTIVKTYTSGDTFQVDLNNMQQDQDGYLWAPAADSMGNELGCIELSAAHAGSKPSAIPMLHGESGWSFASVATNHSISVRVAPSAVSAEVKTLAQYDAFWYDGSTSFTDANGQIWIPVYAQEDDTEYPECGWMCAEIDTDFYLIDGQVVATGMKISHNGITYTLYGGYNSWTTAKEMCKLLGGDDVQPVRMQLAVVHNDAEQAIIAQLLNATSNVDKAWIGASKTSGSWKWMDGTNVQYSQWGYNEPSGTGTELGMVASFDGSWYAYDDYLNIHIQGFITEQFTGIGLPQVKLPASTFYVDDEAFVGDNSIRSVVAPEGLIVIGTRAFADCANLKCITLPDSVSYIAEDAFENTPDVVIFASVGSYAWRWAEEQDIPHGTPYTE